ncbi:hypothetical protein M4I21_00670 [Cellulophaga sp. 20_2_10]|uniref:hypothetical protein n=1 Tax=Cellulophaga sp. 20_2_10 TaxID=2942476 RepID=UPI00201AD065|nr:hypothetical protein [Cellulophaga sp. 20_2_10]MCL5244301.1 hypothetical protein [Cellulophaga sp. 20_2_10]
MKKILHISAVLVFACLLCTACKNTEKQEQHIEEQSIKKQEESLEKDATVPEENKPVVTSATLCFRNELVHKIDTTKKDVVELLLTIKGETVIGSYVFAPADKDRRNGMLMGTIKDDVIDARYDYFFKEKQSKTTLKIYLKDTTAVIEGGAPELGLETTITKIDCDDFRE